MRKLASIQRVWKIEPIENADNLEKASVEGWTVVVPKGQFKPMDLAVYFEIDSFLPVDERYEFLRKTSYKNTNIMGEGFKLRTLKLRGVLSQGLLLPLSEFPEIENPKLGQDVTTLLRVKKWEIEEMATTGGNTIGKLSYDVPHTDEVRCFTHDTKIITDNGLMRIGEIVNKRIKCKVLAYNEITEQTEWAEITNYFSRNSKEFRYCITYPFRYNENRTNTLKGSYNHKILTQNGWTELKNVNVGDTVFTKTTRYDKYVIQFIAGMLLGDAHMSCEKRLQKDGSTYNKRRISFCQGEKQAEYLKEKLRILGCNKPLREAKSGYTDNNVYQVSLDIDDTIEEWLISVLGNNKKKTITKQYAQYLSLVSFAFLYMDDGSLHRYNDDRNWSSQISISTNAYTKEENEILLSRLQDFGLNAKIYSTNKNGKIYYSLHFSVKESQKFQHLIAIYVHPSMRYKLDEKYQNYPYALENYTVPKLNNIIGVPVLNKKIEQVSKYARRSKLYNIETTPNHNYFANGILVHNCQNFPEYVKEFAGLEYYITTKMDGSSHSISVDEDGFHACGHNYEYKDDGSSSFYEFIKSKNFHITVPEYARKMGYKTLTIQGEFCAPGIQRNRLKLVKPEWYVFTIRVNGNRVGLETMSLIVKDLGMEMVPVEEIGRDFSSKYPTIESVLERAEGQYPNGGPKEGIVIRPTEPVYSETIGGSLSMKAVSNKYLLKNEN